MFKKEITFKDYNDVERKESFYFNLTKAELTEMELSQQGGLGKTIEKVVETKEIPKIMEIFKNLIQKSYGVKSEDGRRFKKSDEITKEFTETEAYSILFMELATDSDAAAAFVNGIIPADMNVNKK